MNTQTTRKLQKQAEARTWTPQYLPNGKSLLSFWLSRPEENKDKGAPVEAEEV